MVKYIDSSVGSVETFAGIALAILGVGIIAAMLRIVWNNGKAIKNNS